MSDSEASRGEVGKKTEDINGGKWTPMKRVYIV